MTGTSEPLALGERMKLGAEALENGTWKPHVQSALDNKIAGEPSAKWLMFYSGLSSKLPVKVHSFVMGKSQRGKSFLQEQIGATLFSVKDTFQNVTEQSGKAMFYEVKETNNPDLYRHKILYINEFKDASQDTKNFIKKLTSHKCGPLTLKTVVDQKFMSVTITSVPVVWTNSMEVLKDDVGNQIMNRFFKCNVNEDISQSERVEDFQRDQIMLGELAHDETIAMARTIVGLIFEETDFVVLNPFIKFIKVTDHSVLNRLPMFEALVGAVCYANWRNRPRFEKNGQKYLLASLDDNLEALRLWHENERFQLYAVPERYLKFLKIFETDGWYDNEDMAESYRTMYGEVMSPQSCYAYAHYLEEKDILFSRKREGTRSKEYCHGYNSNKSNIHVLDLVPFTPELLAECVKAIFKANLTSHMNVRDSALDLEATINKLLDSELPKEKVAVSPQMKLEDVAEHQEVSV